MHPFLTGVCPCRPPAEGAEPAATPLPISNPFQARFRAAGLSAGQYHVLDEAGSEDEVGDDSGDSDSDGLDEDELMEMLDAGQWGDDRLSDLRVSPSLGNS